MVKAAFKANHNALISCFNFATPLRCLWVSHFQAAYPISLSIFRAFHPMLDIIIPCYNAAHTLPRAVQSCLNQPEAERIWLIDDASTDNTWQTIEQLKQQSPHKIQAVRQPENGGAAMARNWGAMQSQAELIAFLDADDEYQQGALSAACFAFAKFDFLGLIRLRLHAVGLPEHYRQHPNFARAWHSVQMTVGGNTVFRRVFFLACGGFPHDDLFRQFGGEDGALGLATVGSSVVGTLFDEREPAVLHYWRDDIHAAHLLDAILFNQNPRHVTAHDIQRANQVTQHIQQQLGSLKTILAAPQAGMMPLLVNRQ